MKIGRLFFGAFLSLLTISALAQDQPMVNYYKSINFFDLSKIWKSDKLRIFEGDVKYIDFPEPLGYIGTDYQRFYIHYTSVIKDDKDPYKYWVKGKTRVGGNICNFSGSVTIIKASVATILYYGKYKQGIVVCDVDFKEDSTCSGSGFIKGQLTSNWFLDKKHIIHYDSIDSEADGFANNQCEATWTSYKNHVSKKCYWGDFRIPNSDKLDEGAGEFMVADKYVKYGWGSYMNSMYQNKSGYKKALAEENKKWWL